MWTFLKLPVSCTKSFCCENHITSLIFVSTMLQNARQMRSFTYLGISIVLFAFQAVAWMLLIWMIRNKSGYTLHSVQKCSFFQARPSPWSAFPYATYSLIGVSCCDDFHHTVTVHGFAGRAIDGGRDTYVWWSSPQGFVEGFQFYLCMVGSVLVFQPLYFSCLFV
jgi:hypothetical protein